LGKNSTIFPGTEIKFVFLKSSHPLAKFGALKKKKKGRKGDSNLEYRPRLEDQDVNNDGQKKTEVPPPGESVGKPKSYSLCFPREFLSAAFVVRRRHLVGVPEERGEEIKRERKKQVQKF
jgi:hypothetical protein